MKNLIEKINRHRKLFLSLVVTFLLLVVVTKLFFGVGQDPAESLMVQERGKKVAREGQGKEAMIRAYFQEATVAHKKGDEGSAIASLDKLLQLDPLHEEAKKFKGVVEKAAETSHQKGNAALQEELWIRDLIQKVQGALNAGEPLTAKAILHQILEEKPNHEQATALLEKMEKDKEQTRLSLELQQKEKQLALQEAERLYREGRREEQAGKIGEAYRRYLELGELMEKKSIRPDFYDPFQKDQKRVTDRLIAEMEPHYQEAVRQMKEARLLERTEEKGELYSRAVEKLASLNQPGLPPHPAGKQKLQEAYQALNDLAELDFVKAKTLDELENCSLAGPGYKRAMQIARFPEVPVYQMAKEALEKCPNS